MTRFVDSEPTPVVEPSLENLANSRSLEVWPQETHDDEPTPLRFPRDPLESAPVGTTPVESAPGPAPEAPRLRWAALKVVILLGCLAGICLLVGLAVFNWRANQVATRSASGAMAGSRAGDWPAGPQIGRAISGCDLPQHGVFRLSIFLLKSDAIELAMVPGDTRLDGAQIRCIRQKLAGLPLDGAHLTGVVKLVVRPEAGRAYVDLAR